MNPMYSKPDSRGTMFVDCSECTRGGNGNRDCGSGCMIKKGMKGGCFSGILLEKYQEANLK